MEEVKRIKTKVKRVLNRRTGEQRYYIEVTETGKYVRRYKGPLFYVAKRNANDSLPVPKTVWINNPSQAKAAARLLALRINRPLPGGPTLLEWLRREAAALDKRINGC